jgi:hypothetical protein
MSPEEIAAVAEQAIKTRKRSQRNKVSARDQTMPSNTLKQSATVPPVQQDVETPKLGRPSSFTQEVADLICDGLAEGYSLRKICREESMPNISTVCRWLATNEDFRKQYAHAREVQADTLFDETLDIADDGRNDTYLDEDGNPRTNHDVIARSKLRVETRKWMAGKLKPKVYGDKIDVDHGVQKDNPLLTLLQQISGTALPIKKDGAEE